MESKLIKYSEKEFWKCDRCEIDSNTKGRNIPCPRGECEAESAGKIITTKVLIMDQKQK